jgi:eukaryotic-like serine/threonine-protein kinase
VSVADKPATRLWREALARFEGLLEKPPAERRRLLADLADTQPQLHSMLVSLLDADERADSGGFLDPSRLDRGALAPGAQLGPYRIETRIGAGGMGEVWRASRVDGLYQGHVAIKTLHPYFGGGALRERFLREALILGRLQHPGIARLLDAGVTDDGSVYLVLEYVLGSTIDAWCDEQKLDIDARLRLFLDVCAAVAHAHANLVVHRDIKPSNILVAGGQVKLLDFGVAKLLETESPATKAELTRMTGRIFTPEYAAPEQILGEAITTATDVYSLGVLLHVLLTGTRPHGTRDNPVEIERAVLHDEPVRASGAVSPDGGAADARSTTVARWKRALSGDLDNIIARALCKKPQERYSSVPALADDVRRHLAHQPILARPENVTARARKFIRRHRAGVAAASIAVIALGAGVAGVWWQAQVARTEARKATAIRDFVVGIFERNSTSHPDGARARKTTAEELLAQAGQEIRTGLEDAPEVRTELLGMMARLYANMEMQKDALPLLEEQLASQRRSLGAKHADVARTLTQLASSHSQNGDYPATIRSATEAQEIFRAHHLESALEYAQTYRILGHANYRLGNYQDGTLVKLYETGLALVVKHHPRDPERMSMLTGLGRAEQIRGNHARSLALIQEAAKLAEDGVLELDGIQRGGLYQSLGDQLNWAARNDEAETYMRKAVAEFEKAGGPDHPYVSDGKRALGMLLAWQGRREEARSLLQSAFDTQRRARGDDDPHLTTVIRMDLGRVLLWRGEYFEGEQHLQRVMKIWNASGQPTLTVSIQLGRLYTEQGRFDLAAKELVNADGAAAKMFGPGSWHHASALNRLGTLCLAQGRASEARRYFERSDAETKDVEGLSPNRAYARAALLRLALAENDPRAVGTARALLAQIEAAKTRRDMPDEEAAANMLLGVALSGTGKLPDARPYLQKAVDMRARMDAPDSPLLAEARLYLARQRAADGAPDEARALIADAERALSAQPVDPRLHRLLAETRRGSRKET